MRSCRRPCSSSTFSICLGREILAELHVELVVAVENGLGSGHALLDVLLHRLLGVELRLLVKEADRDAVGGKRLADERRVFARHDPEQRALARAVEAEHADLGAGEEREPDVLEDLGVGRMHLPEPLHRVDVLHSIQRGLKTASIARQRTGRPGRTGGQVGRALIRLSACSTRPYPPTCPPSATAVRAAGASGISVTTV